MYDVAGQRVRLVGSGEQESGPHVAWWDGRDESGRAVASGVYLGCLRVGGHRWVRPLLLLK